MASIDEWSDSEIRSKLAELGTPVGPVTETTRKTLVKKLKKLLQSSEGNAAGGGRTRRSISRFSSGDEDSQEDAPSMPPPSRTRTLRRRTVGPGDLTSTNDARSSPLRDSGSSTNKIVTKVTRKSTGGITTAPKDDFDSGSDSDVPLKSFTSSVSGRRALNPESPPTARTYISPDSSTARTFGSSKIDSGIGSRISPGTSTEPGSAPSRSYSNFKSETTTTSTRQYVTTRPDPLTPSLFSSSRADLDRGSTSVGTPYPYSRTSFSSVGSRGLESSRIYDKVSSEYRKNVVQGEEDVESEEEEEENGSSGFQSEFLSRLQGKNRSSSTYKPATSSRGETASRVFSRTSISPSRTMLSSNLHIFDKYKNMSLGGYGSKLSAATRDLFSSKKSSDYPERLYPGKSKSEGRLCSNALLYLIIATLAMVIAGVVYISMGPNPLGLESDDNTYPICDSENTTQPCIESKDLQPALKLLSLIKPKLHELAVDAYCNSAEGSSAAEVPAMSEREAVEFLLKKLPKLTKSFQVESDLRRLKILILANPHWDVKVVDDGGTGVEDPKALVVTGGLAAQHVSYPAACVVGHLAYGLARWALLLSSVLAAAGLGLFGYRFYKRRREQHRRDVYSMVTRVLVMLTGHHEQDPHGYVAVDNCRDELIPPAERDAMKNVWDAAVDFVEKHESRVRTELHNVRGENVKVWRWLPAKANPPADGPKLDRLL